MNKTLRRILHLLVIISILLIIGVGSTFITSAEVGDTFTVNMHLCYPLKYSIECTKVPIEYRVINENPKEVEIIKYESNITSFGDYCADLPNKVTNPNNNQSYTVTAIGDSAFKDCNDWFEIDIPDNVKTIGDEAFSGCENLDEINLPNSLITIGYGAFYNCSNLTNLNIPDNVTTIGNEAFYNCSKLSEVTSYTYSPAHIGSDVFGECPVDIIIPAGTTTSYVTAGWPKNDLSELIKSVKVVDESGNPIEGVKVILYLNKYNTFALTGGYTNSDGIDTCTADILCDTIEVKKSGYQQIDTRVSDNFELVVVMKR